MKRLLKAYLQYKIRKMFSVYEFEYAWYRSRYRLMLTGKI